MSRPSGSQHPSGYELARTDEGVVVRVPRGDLAIRYIMGVGLNYRLHAEEQDAKLPERPVVFTKNPMSVILSGETIEIPPICRDVQTGGPEQVDFEAELAVVLDRPARDVPREHALDHVLGYCCANDVSARWWQKQGSGKQFCRGKSFDTFCPLGPVVVPADRVPDPQALGISCIVNGETMQSASTADMIFPVDQLISELSRGTTLPAGTVILTGTPSGVGMARNPQRFLREGDAVTIAVEGLGELTNPVRNAAEPAAELLD
ncbi:MAG: fumarylacetoacetate hydrolase family protein [Planctomycetota bacterium]